MTPPRVIEMPPSDPRRRGSLRFAVVRGTERVPDSERAYRWQAEHATFPDCPLCAMWEREKAK